MKTKHFRFEKMNARVSRWIEVSLNSGTPDSDYNTSPYITFRAFDYVFEISRLPSWVLRPYEEWVNVSYPGCEPGKGYYQYDERSYGFSIFDDHFNFRYGRMSDESNKEQRWGFTLPWLDEELVRITLLNPDYTIIHTNLVGWSFPQREELEKQVPKMIYAFTDADGSENRAVCHMEEREWRKGRSKWWKWLRLFNKPIVQRYLYVEFDREAGKEQGSYKGGACSLCTPIESLTTPLDTFKKWAEKERITNIQRVQ